MIELPELWYSDYFDISAAAVTELLRWAYVDAAEERLVVDGSKIRVEGFISNNTFRICSQ